jgi:hypothetical protein
VEPATRIGLEPELPDPATSTSGWRAARHSGTTSAVGLKEAEKEERQLEIDFETKNKIKTIKNENLHSRCFIKCEMYNSFKASKLEI